LRIFGGFTAEKGEFPWQALIRTADSFGGGALLYDNWILTAAHVVYGYANSVEISVVLGTLWQNAHPAVEVISENVIIHEGYKGENLNFDNDIALIKLNRRVSLGQNILPICLPGTEERYIVKEGDRGYVSGWGLTERKVISRKLKYVDVAVGNHSVCKEVYSKQIREGIPLNVTDNMFCGGEKQGGKDSCAGDSGGAYVFYDPILQRWYVAGIVSWGLENCGQAGFYGVYTNVLNYISWIEETISTH
uniref:mannan-binding lectin serine protease 2-like n=1 Tax=Pristiophorus japonicus TaxID=55135 RepID=UPI00398EBA82